MRFSAIHVVVALGALLFALHASADDHDENGSDNGNGPAEREVLPHAGDDDELPTPVPIETFREEVARLDRAVQRRAREWGEAGQQKREVEQTLEEVERKHADAAMRVRQLNRRLEEMGDGLGRRHHHLTDTLADIEDELGRDRAKLGAGDEAGEAETWELREKIAENEILKAQIEAQIERLHADSGFADRRRQVLAERDKAAERLEAAVLDKRAARRALSRAWEAIDRAEQRHAEAQQAYDRYVASAPALLRAEEPPHLVEVHVESNGIDYYDATMTESAVAHEQWHRQLEAANRILEEQQALVFQLRRDFRRQERRFVESSERWQQLNAAYEGQVYNNAFMTTLVDSLNSIHSVLDSGKPPQMLADAGVELAFKLYDWYYFEEPAFAKFPDLPDEVIAARQNASGNAAADAALRFNLEDFAADRREQIRSFLQTYREQTAGATDAEGADATARPSQQPIWRRGGVSRDVLQTMAFRTAVKTTIKNIAKNRGFGERVGRRGYLRAVRGRYFNQLGLGRLWDDAKAVSGGIFNRVRNARRSVSQFVRRDLLRGRPTLTQMRENFSENLVKHVAGSLAKHPGIREQADIYMQMFMEEMVWLYERKIYHHLAHQLRQEKRHLDVVREERDRIRAVRDQTLSLRRLDRSDQLLDSTHTEYQLRLEFSEPVRHVELALDLDPAVYSDLDHNKPRFEPRGDPDEAREVHHYTMHLFGNIGGNHEQIRAALRVKAEATTGQALDGDPFTVARYDFQADTWSGYEDDQPDRTHKLKVGYTPEHQVPESLVILVDASGSMEGDRLKQANRTAARLLGDESPLSRGSEVACWAFTDGTPRLVQDFTHRRDRLAKRINALEADGGTPLAEAIRKAGAYLLQRGQFDKKILVLLSDGKADDQAVAQAIGQLRQRSIELREGAW
jgi:Mg-chelatase subunit ChlD